MNAAETFQLAVAEAVNQAAKDNVHPATVYTVLGMSMEDVSQAIRRSAQLAQMNAAARAKDAEKTEDKKTADQIIESGQAKSN